MEPGEAKKRFEDMIAASGAPLASLTPSTGIELMLRFYRDTPADEDVLYFTWGAIDGVRGESYGCIISRVFRVDLDDLHAYEDLSLTFEIEPKGFYHPFQHWCVRADDLPRFRSAIEASEPLVHCEYLLVTGVTLACETSSEPPSRSDGRRGLPKAVMNEEQWLRSDDVAEMLRWLRGNWRGGEVELDRVLRRFYLSCCRRIWKLLPLEESRRCVEVAERHLEGGATDEELRAVDWYAEGAAGFFQDGFEEIEPERVARCIEEVEAISPVKLSELIGPAYPTAWDSTRDLLADAAYLVVLVACYPDISPIDNIERTFEQLLSPALLREIVSHTIALEK